MMPGLDDRISAALRDGAHAAGGPPAPDVMERIAAKRVRQRAVRRVQRGTIAAVCAVAVVAASFVALGGGDDTRSTRIAAPPGRSDFPQAQVIRPDGQSARVPVHVIALDPDEGYVRGPVLVQGKTITAAAYDRSGDSFTLPPSRIVRFSLDGHVLDRVDLKGEVLSLAEGEGARWALTRDKEVLAPPDPEFRVKRIGPNGSVTSNAVPRGFEPVGDIFAGGGAVWLPVADGVLRFDTATGAFEMRVPLASEDEHHSIAVVGKAAVITDGTVLRTLDPSADAAGVVAGSNAPTGFVYRDISPGAPSAMALGTAENGSSDPILWHVRAFDSEPGVVLSGPVPGATSLVTTRDATWLGLVVDGQPALRALADPLAGQSTIRTRKVADGLLVPIDAGTALIVSRGAIFRVDLPR